MPAIIRSKPPQVFDPYRDVERAQDLSREGVKAYGEMLRPELLKDIGDTLGGLNSIGALRSGGTKVALDDISRSYTDRIGQYASLSTQSAIGSGLQAGNLRLGERQQNFAESEAKRARKGRLLSAIGSVVGAGIGFAIGGPPGAVAGAKASGFEMEPVTGGGG